MRTLFERDVYVRLSEDGTRLISTTTYGRIFRRTAEFDMDCAGKAEDVRETEDARETIDEKSLAPLKKRWSDWQFDDRQFGGQ
jgi:hypothetical protein